MSLAAELGVKFHPLAGATWSYGKDPKDTNIRIAPTFPPLEELGQALDVLPWRSGSSPHAWLPRPERPGPRAFFRPKAPFLCFCCRRPGKTGALGAK